MRKKTKHGNNPVQAVRLICELSQAEFAARVGYEEDYIKKVECGVKTISLALKNRIFLFCGALIEPGHPVKGIGPNNTLAPFTLEIYQSYRDRVDCSQAAAGSDRFFGTTEEMINSLKFSIEVWLDEAKKAKYAHTGLADGKLYGLMEELIGHLGLREHLRERIEALSKSPNEKAKGIARCLCLLTGSFDLMNAWLSERRDTEKKPSSAVYPCSISTGSAASDPLRGRTR